MALRFAVVGCGLIGRFHAQLLDGGLGDSGRLSAVVGGSPTARAALAEQHGAAALGSLDEALARIDVDAVSVCVPSGRHAEIALKALEAGKHVIIEKPVDVRVENARPLIAARDRAGKVVTVISQRRFSPAALRLRGAISAGRFGRLTSGLASLPWWRTEDYYTDGGWRGTWELDGGGALMNQAIHLIDLLIWFLGDPVEVSSFCATLAHPHVEVEDTAGAVVRFASGTIGVIHGTTAAYPGCAARLCVYGDRGSAEMVDDNLTFFHTSDLEPPGQVGPLSDRGHALERGSPTVASSPSGYGDPAATVNIDGLRLAYLDFLGSVTSGRPPLVTVEEAIRPVAVVQAIYESSRTGRPVRIEES